MFFTGKGVKFISIWIITPHPKRFNTCYSKILSPLAYIHAKIAAKNNIFSPYRRESRSLFEYNSHIRTAREVFALFNSQTCKDPIRSSKYSNKFEIELLLPQTGEGIF